METKIQKVERMLERLVDQIGEMEYDCDSEVYESLLRILYAIKD